MPWDHLLRVSDPAKFTAMYRPAPKRKEPLRMPSTVSSAGTAQGGFTFPVHVVKSSAVHATMSSATTSTSSHTTGPSHKISSTSSTSVASHTRTESKTTHAVTTGGDNKLSKTMKVTGLLRRSFDNPKESATSSSSAPSIVFSADVFNSKIEVSQPAAATQSKPVESHPDGQKHAFSFPVHFANKKGQNSAHPHPSSSAATPNQSKPSHNPVSVCIWKHSY